MRITAEGVCLQNSVYKKAWPPKNEVFMAEVYAVSHFDQENSRGFIAEFIDMFLFRCGHLCLSDKHYAYDPNRFTIDGENCCSCKGLWIACPICRARKRIRE